jgi:hypothetical protein
MHHHSRFDQLVAATEELIHESERMRLNIRPLRQRFRKSWTTKRPYGALRKATSEVTRLTMQHLEGDEAHRPSHIVAQVRPALGGTVTPVAKVAAARRRNTKRQVLDAPPDLIP